MATNLESAKRILEFELKEAPYVKENLYGNEGCSRKIENYIIESFRAGVMCGNCLDWLVELLQANDVEQEQINKTRDIAESQYSILKRAEDNKNKKK